MWVVDPVAIRTTWPTIAKMPHSDTDAGRAPHSPGEEPGGRAGRRRSGKTLRCAGRASGAGGGVVAHGEQQIGLVRAPAVADAEIHRRRRGLLEQLLELRLVGAREDAERREVMPEGLELPLLPVEMGERNPGIVFQDRRAVC